MHRRRLSDEVANALLAAAYECWTKPGVIMKRASWTTEDAVAWMAGRPAVENIVEWRVCMLSGCLEDVEPPPQSVADVERSQYKASWHEAMKVEVGGHKTTGTHEAATPPQGWKAVSAKWVFTYKTDENGLIV